jgi:hypothetical protein
METIAEIRKDLAERRGDYARICEETGLAYFWLSKFVRGVIREPGHSKIERLKQYIAAHPLPGTKAA